MELRHIGYACINLSLGATTNHTFRLAKLSEEQAIQTIAQNLTDLRQILSWNVANGIRLFRVGSSMIPFASHPSFTLDWAEVFQSELREIRAFGQQNGLRFSMHPGQYTVLNALNPKVVQDAIRELEWHAELMAQLDPDQGLVVLHVGGAYGDKGASIQRFEENFQYLSENARQRLTIENDDTTFNADETLSLCQRLGVPMIFDIFHHKCLHQAGDWRDGLTDKLAAVVNTWAGKVPKLHISTQKAGTRTSHADYISSEDFEELQYWMHSLRTGTWYDLMVEAKMKDLAVQRLLRYGLPKEMN